MIDDLIAHFGGLSATAKAFGVSAPSVHEWRAAGRLPIQRCGQAELLTEGKFTREMLRPEIFGNPEPARGVA